VNAHKRPDRLYDTLRVSNKYPSISAGDNPSSSLAGACQVDYLPVCIAGMGMSALAALQGNAVGPLRKPDVIRYSVESVGQNHNVGRVRRCTS
jgi:hypothetical protein